MAITDLWNDLVESLLPTVALAEEEEHEEEAQEDNTEEQEGDDEKEEDNDDEEEEDDEDDDEEEEPEDPFPAVREAAADGPCHAFKHHFEECVERVTKEMEEPDYHEKEHKEDCIEEFFHLNHCIDEEIAPSFFQKHTK